MPWASRPPRTSTQEAQRTMAESATILILDISGYTEFLTKTELVHSSHIINELLEAILAANDNDFVLSEVEGDALLLYRKGTPIEADALVRQCVGMFESFHKQIKIIERDSLCQCGACKTASNLSLKFIAHHGTVQEIRVMQFTKCSGLDMVVAHRLLKNRIPSDEYILVTPSCFEVASLEQAPGALAWERSSEEYPAIGTVQYQHAPLAGVRDGLPDPGERSMLVLDRPDGGVLFARSLPRESARRLFQARDLEAGRRHENVLVRWNPVLQQAVGDDHVEARALRELHHLDLLDRAVMGDEFEAQVRGGLAGAALAERVPLDDLDLLVEALEHAHALPDERVGFDRRALAIEQERVAFHLGEHEVVVVGGEDRLEQLVDDVGAVHELGLGQELGVAADVEDQDRCALGHGTLRLLGRCPGGTGCPGHPSLVSGGRGTWAFCRRSGGGDLLARARARVDDGVHVGAGEALHRLHAAGVEARRPARLRVHQPGQAEARGGDARVAQHVAVGGAALLADERVRAALHRLPRPQAALDDPALRVGARPGHRERHLPVEIDLRARLPEAGHELGELTLDREHGLVRVRAHVDVDVAHPR